jgi:MFS family permease
VDQETDEQETGEALAREQIAGGSRHFGRHARYAVLRNRDFMRYTVARNIAMIGSQMTGVAVGWDLYGRTRDPMALAYVGLVQFVPVLLLALPAGHAADRFGRKEIVQSTQLLVVLSSLAMGVVALLRAPVSLVYLCLFLAAVARGFSGPARSAMLPQFVPQSQYEDAIKWSTSVFQLTSTGGPALGGLVIGAAGHTTLVYFLDAACGVLAFLLTMWAIPRYAVQRTNTAPHTLESLTAGLRFVWRTRIILATITLDLFAVLFGGAVALLPIYATDVLGVGAKGLGMMESAPSAGALCMAFTLTHMPPLRKPGTAMLWAVAGFGAATIVFGVSRWFPLSLVMLFLTGAFDNISVVVRSTLVQVLTPDEMLGRVSAVNNVFITSSNQLGGFESGALARLLGPIRSVVLGGIGTLLVVAAIATQWPEVREFGAVDRPAH